MERTGKAARVLDWCWFLAWGVASSAWCLTAAGQLGATFDEPIYLQRGLEFWHTGSHHGLLKLGTMPLAPDLQTLPLYLWERWHGTSFDLATDADRMLPWARATTLVFWWLLLCYGRLAGRLLGGGWGGRLAVALLACEPSLLAHAGLATTDIAVTACVLALVYHYRMGRGAGWFRRIGLPAFWYGAAILAKASGLVFGPICLLVVELCLITHSPWDALRHPWKVLGALWEGTPNGPGEKPLHFRRDFLHILAGAMVLVFVYCGCDWRPEPTFVAWAQSLPDGWLGRSMVWASEHLCIFSNAGEGIIRQVKHNRHGHGVYLLGMSDPRSFWYYFPVALTIKLSLPLLVLPVVLLALRPRALANWACLAAAALVLFSLNCHVQIGIRLILPLVALLIVGLAAAVAQVCAREPSAEESVRSGPFQGGVLTSRLLAAGVGVCLLWTATSAVAVWPHGLCYVNELWGGSEKGYLCLSDSNYDWGQGLKELVRWEEQHGVAEMDVWYFGTDTTLPTLPLREVPFHLEPTAGPEVVRNKVRGRYLAVSTTLLYGMAGDTPGHVEAAAFLHTLKPVARTTTYLIYDFRHEPGNATEQARASNP